MRNFGRLINFLFYFGIFLIFFLPPVDPDLGWQFRCGEEFWTQGQNCSPNHFSVLLANFPYVNHAFGYQLLIHPVFKLTGFWGLSFLNAFVLTTVFYLLLKLPGNKNLKLILTPIAIFFAWSTFAFGIRSQIFSLVYFILTLFMIVKSEKPKNLLFLPLIIFLWSNTHGSFVLGIIMLTLLLFQKTIDLTQKKIEISKYLNHLLVCFVSFLVSFINPSTYKIYQEALRHFFQARLDNLIAEWVPPNLLTQVVIVLFLILCVLVLFKEKNQNLKIFKFLVLVALTILALKARRNLPEFFIFTVFLITQIKQDIKNSEVLGLLASLSLLTVGLLFLLPNTITANRNFKGFCSYSYSPPFACNAVEFLKQQPKGNIFNTYEQGGFLIWQLPEDKVFVDGRMPAWETSSGKSPYTIYLETLQTQPGWDKTLKDYKIDWLLIGPGTFMDIKIKDNPASFGWKEMYRDTIAVVYKKI